MGEHIDLRAAYMQDVANLMVEVERLRAFVRKVADYSNDGWLAREALAHLDGSGSSDA
jgi:hypothetical protein